MKQLFFLIGICLFYSCVNKKDASKTDGFVVIFNGKKCKFTLISMNNTKVIENKGKFDKDKSSERSNKILPEEATHFSDAADKRIWTKYGELLFKRLSTFVDAKI